MTRTRSPHLVKLGPRLWQIGDVLSRVACPELAARYRSARSDNRSVCYSGAVLNCHEATLMWGIEKSQPCSPRPFVQFIAVVAVISTSGLQ